MSQIIVALDTSDRMIARSTVDELASFHPWFKIGKELFVSHGQQIVEDVVTAGAHVFLDLKFHDIPNTAAQATRAAAELGVRMVNVHASGGRTMMEAAANALKDISNPPLLIAVTVLTSMGADELREVGIEAPLEQHVLRLATLAKESGLNGVVCSAREVRLIKEHLGEDFLTITPGIRPAWSTTDDQTRITTPADAVKLGTDFMVIGRPITKHKRPQEGYALIQEEIDTALRG